MKPYTRIFKSDHDKALELGSTSLLTYLALCRIHSDAPPEEKGLFRGGAARIMRHSGLSRRAVQESVKRLAAEGLITIKSGCRKDRKTDHEENQITLKGSAPDALGSARNEGIRCARIKKAPKGAKKEGRSAGVGADAPPASGSEEIPTTQNNTINTDFDYL